MQKYGVSTETILKILAAVLKILYIILFIILLPVSQRIHLFQVFKLNVKIGRIIEPAIITYLGNIHVLIFDE